MDIGMVKHIGDTLITLVEQFSGDYREKLEGLSHGVREQTPDEQARWYESMVQSNPNWERALQFVDGGPEETRKYLAYRGSQLREIDDLVTEIEDDFLKGV